MPPTSLAGFSSNGERATLSRPDRGYTDAMDEPYDPTRPTLERLEREMDKSAADLAAGRVKPIGPVLDAMVARAKERIEAKAKAVKKAS